VPIAADFEKRILCVAGSTDERAGAIGLGADGEDRGDSPALQGHVWLADDHGIRVGRKRVARLMRAAGLRGATLRRYVVTTQVDSSARPAVDLVDRQFYAEGPDRLWVADITYVPTWSGFLYLSMVLDVYSRRVVGWAMETHLRTELILAALNMAVTQRRPHAVIHHSDRGCQPGFNWSSQHAYDLAIVTLH
jgi:transposase InsO family protein